LIREANSQDAAAIIALFDRINSETTARWRAAADCQSAVDLAKSPSTKV
jgi:hypothetical protein